MKWAFFVFFGLAALGAIMLAWAMYSVARMGEVGEHNER